jgi:hypothetical protein
MNQPFQWSWELDDVLLLRRDIFSNDCRQLHQKGFKARIFLAHSLGIVTRKHEWHLRVLQKMFRIAHWGTFRVR